MPHSMIETAEKMMVEALLFNDLVVLAKPTDGRMLHAVNVLPLRSLFLMQQMDGEDSRSKLL